MKAAVRTRYGPPEAVRIVEVDRPAIKSDEVLVKVQATTVNRTDCGFRAGKPFIVRFFAGLLRPKATGPGLHEGLQGLMASGAFRPVIDRRYRLDEIVEAYRYVETGNKTGNVVITVTGSTG